MITRRLTAGRGFPTESICALPAGTGGSEIGFQGHLKQARTDQAKLDSTPSTPPYAVIYGSQHNTDAVRNLQC
jgi:hypothetical protein